MSRINDKVFVSSRNQTNISLQEALLYRYSKYHKNIVAITTGHTTFLVSVKENIYGSKVYNLSKVAMCYCLLKHILLYMKLEISYNIDI